MEMAVNVVAKYTVLFKDVTDVVISRHNVGMLPDEHEPLGILSPVALPEIICAHAPMPPAEQNLNDTAFNNHTSPLVFTHKTMEAVEVANYKQAESPGSTCCLFGMPAQQGLLQQGADLKSVTGKQSACFQQKAVHAA